jgi:hypothetical protein
MEKLKKRVVQFIKREYGKTGKNPSIREICKRLTLTNKALYKAFPGGISEMCAAAGVPEDKTNRIAVEKASRALREKRMRVASEGQLDFLREKAEKVVRENRLVEMTEKMKKSILEGELKISSNLEGLLRIFNDPQRMLEFTENTITSDCLILNDSNVLDSFKNYCKTRGFDLAKKLFQVVGPLEDFETQTEEKEVHRYIEGKLEGFLMDCEEEQKRKRMQVEFEETLRNSICEFCGRRATTAFLKGNKLCCPCGNITWQLLCPNCQQILQFESEIGAFYCHKCNIPYRINRHRYER